MGSRSKKTTAIERIAAKASTALNQAQSVEEQHRAIIIMAMALGEIEEICQQARS